ncbi:phage minor head protein [Pseudomonas sp.]|uniref:phage head morphogenesis protein n=1 Tax=Pseudomonas sp. TaxID=306 RepID=UPI002587B054|nr:phage minor head protein [Pseudomonas sp.]
MISSILRRYADALNDWAIATASRMLSDVDQQDRKAWAARTEEMGRALRDEIRNAPTGEALRGLMAEQVTLIKSIPLEAAKRVHELTLRGIEDSTRASEISREILRSGEVAESRARLIARTEVARTAANLTEARATSVGSVEYIWRTSGDSDVREDHKDLNGKVFRWDTPPVADQHSGSRAHPGTIYNCRCYAEPIIPE